MTKAKVFFVGAGPGDPALLTIKAQRLLKSADVVLVDFLTHPNFRFLTSNCCEWVSVGKRKGHHSKQQSEINQLILSYYQDGKRVVRLKGGDPLMFGRGGEEMSFLRERDIPYEVVPGVSAAMAVPTYAGIPLTYRQVSRSVAFVTGSLKSGPEDIDIPSADTLVFFMPVTHLSHIVHRLLDSDRFHANTPVALVYQGTYADQSCQTSTLGNVLSDWELSTLKTPSLFVVGEVVALSENLDWRSFLPLAGRRVMLLRPPEQSQELMESLQAQGAEVLLNPVIESRSISGAFDNLDASFFETYSKIIFTSQYSVRLLFEEMLNRGLDARLLAGKTIMAVGAKTSDELKRFSLISDYVPAKFQATEIISGLDQNLDGDHILIPCSAIADEGLVKELENRGAIVNRWAIYDTYGVAAVSGKPREGDYVVFTSPSTVRSFCEQFSKEMPSIHPISIGPTTSEEIKKRLNLNPLQAKEASTKGITSLLLSL